MVRNPPADAGDIRVAGSILGSGRSLGEGNGNPIQYSCLGNPMARGARQATYCTCTHTLLILLQREIKELS